MMNDEQKAFSKWFEDQGYDVAHWNFAYAAFMAGVRYGQQTSE